MIHALRYEPQGQRQRFGPHDEPSGDRWHKHIHVHLHLHLSFPMRQGQFSPLSVNRMLRIFVALAGATTMAAWFAWPLYTLATHLIFASLALAWGAVVLGGLPLLVSAWRRSPRVRFLLVVPFIALLIILTQINPLADTLLVLLSLTRLGPYIGPTVLVLFVYPLISAIVLNRAFHRVELSSTALRFGSLLSFVVVGAMVLLLLGGFLFCLSLAPIAAVAWPALLPPLLGMCLAVLVAMHALFWRPRSRSHAKARPKDVSPSEVDSSQEP
jgi:hypothetical protein